LWEHSQLDVASGFSRTFTFSMFDFPITCHLVDRWSFSQNSQHLEGHGTPGEFPFLMVKTKLPCSYVSIWTGILAFLGCEIDLSPSMGRVETLSVKSQSVLATRDVTSVRRGKRLRILHRWRIWLIDDSWWTNLARSSLMGSKWADNKPDSVMPANFVLEEYNQEVYSVVCWYNMATPRQFSLEEETTRWVHARVAIQMIESRLGLRASSLTDNEWDTYLS
jgi:hypothetical protein